MARFGASAPMGICIIVDGRQGRRKKCRHKVAVLGTLLGIVNYLQNSFISTDVVDEKASTKANLKKGPSLEQLLIINFPRTFRSCAVFSNNLNLADKYLSERTYLY